MYYPAHEKESDLLADRFARAIVGLVILAGIILLSMCVKSEAHELPDTRLSCYGLKGPWVQEDEQTAENGMIIETYAHEVGGSIGVITFSIPAPIDQSVEGHSHDDVPLFYVVDLDADDVADMVLIDQEFTGVCTSIVPFEDGDGKELDTRKEI